MPVTQNCFLFSPSASAFPHLFLPKPPLSHLHLFPQTSHNKSYAISRCSSLHSTRNPAPQAVPLVSGVIQKASLLTPSTWWLPWDSPGAGAVSPVSDWGAGAPPAIVSLDLWGWDSHVVVAPVKSQAKTDGAILGFSQLWCSSAPPCWARGSFYYIS